MKEISLINNSMKMKKKRRSKLRIFLAVIFLFFFILFISAFLTFYTYVNLTRISLMDMLITMMPQATINNDINILLLGIDDTDCVQRSDTIMLIHLDTNKDRVGILSIPRDTRVEIPGHGMDKINHAYAFGGVNLSAKAVSNFLQVPINYYAKINLGGLVKIIDRLGGITIDVDKRMHYTDKAGKLYIDLYPGTQLLNGTQAMGYVRFRHDAIGDFGRIKRQQAFMKAVAAKVMQSHDIFLSAELFRELTSDFTSDLTKKQLLIFGLKVRAAFAKNSVVADTVPGTPAMIAGVSYVTPDIPGTIKAVDKVINGIGFIEAPVSPVINNNLKTSLLPSEPTKNVPSEGRPLSARTINRIMPTLREVAKGAVLPSDMHLVLEVLNGNDRLPIAKKVAHRLKLRGIKVAWVRTAGRTDYEKTVIVDWKGKTKEVMQLANALKINPQNILSYNKPGKKVDVTIVLGKDWASTFPAF